MAVTIAVGAASVLSTTVMLSAVVVLVSKPVQAAQVRSYALATASKGGTFYPVGVALATLSRVKLQAKYGFSMSAIRSAGSGENVRLLSDNRAQLAILQGLYGAWAWAGEGRLADIGPQKNLRAITALWQNVEQFVIRSRDVSTGTISDLNTLKGKPFSIGRKGSGTEGSGRTILENLGINPDQFTLVHRGYGASADAMRYGDIEGMNIPAGVPTRAITRAYSGVNGGVQVLNFTDKQIAQANSRYQLWTRYTIAPDTYPGQATAIHTMAQSTFLAVRADLPEADVYQLTRTLYENLPFLNGIHKATHAMAVDKAVEGLPVPLHAGAARYYQEQGISIPPHLLVQ
ncbi:MAG: TAXI family TRAP transporter solute-binding subunit [Marinobacterium sp.]|nr:TAXI family TRAP transporter solute-binding subunit [Marinobacterium sp.]